MDEKEEAEGEESPERPAEEGQLQEEPEADNVADEAAQPEEPDTASQDVEDGEEQAQEARESAETGKPTHRRRQPSLSVQSKMRSSNFRQVPGVKSPPVPDSDGNTAPEVFRKQAVRLEELEKENKRLESDLQSTDARWKKTEEQLEDLREANADVAQLREKLASAERTAEEVEKLVSSMQDDALDWVLIIF